MTNREAINARIDAITMMQALFAIAACFLFASATSPFISTMVVIMWATSAALSLAGAGYGVRAWWIGRRIARNA